MPPGQREHHTCPKDEPQRKAANHEAPLKRVAECPGDHPRVRASRSALQNMLKTFFDGSPEKAVAALLDISRTEITDDELDRLSRLIDHARQEGR